MDGWIDTCGDFFQFTASLHVTYGMSLPGVLQNLQILEASGIVRSKKIGPVRTWRVERAALRRAEKWIAGC
jgi:hypothetical protein